MASNEGRSILITGASTGIGKACALYLDQLGFAVFAGVRRETDASSLAQMASKRLMPVFLDVTDRASINSAFETVSSAVGDTGLYGLVSNAGIAVAGPLEFLAVEKLRDQLEVNVIAHIAMAQEFLPLLRTAEGHIVIMGSIAGRVAWPFVGPYCASKHALEAVADVLRMELRKGGVSVSIVDPGNVRTPIWEKSLAEACHMIDKLPQEAEMLYGQAIDGMKRAVGGVTTFGIAPSRVAKTVARILRTRRPRARYLLGWDARLLVLLRTCLPVRLSDWIITRILIHP